MSLVRSNRTEKARAFWLDIDEAHFEVEETERLNLPYTRFRAYIAGYKAGYLAREEENSE